MSLTRIASLLASATEILYGLGLGEQVVAISHECDWPTECVSKPRATFTNVTVGAASAAIDEQVRAMLAAGAPLYEIDARLLASLQPDLIVTQAQCDVCAVKYDDVLELVRPGGPLAGVLVTALNPFTLEDVFQDIARVGAATDRQREAERYVAALRRRVEAVREVTAPLACEARPSVACIEWIEPLMIAANWLPEMIEFAGGVQRLSVGGAHSTYTPWQRLIEDDPEVIVVMPCGFDLPRTLAEARQLATFAGWSQLRAVRSGRVYACDGNALFNRSGPRLVDSLELLAQLLHPRLFRSHEPGALWCPLTI